MSAQGPGLHDRDHPLTVHGLPLWTEQDPHDSGRTVLCWDGHRGEVHTADQVRDLIDVLKGMLPLLT